MSYSVGMSFVPFVAFVAFAPFVLAPGELWIENY
jgi:hypothetical protein